MQIIELDKVRFPDLWKVKRPPARLWALGSDEALERLMELPMRGLAIVGTRRAQPRALEFVRTCIAPMAHARIIIVSGLARGVDGAAHAAALEAGLPTVAVLGGGVDVAYPWENRELRRRILDSGGVLVSEYAPGSVPLAGQFILRNRLIAGWSSAVWVVQAPSRSGALNTAKWATEQDRKLFTTPAFPADPAFAGNEALADRREVAAELVWGAHSFSGVFNELGVLAPRNGNAQGVLLGALKAPRLSADEEALARFVRVRTGAGGGALVGDSLNWAITEGWDAPRFFSVLQALLLRKRILDRGGALVAL